MNTEAVMPESLYRGALITYPGPWSFLIEKSDLILVRDQDLIDLCDPDCVVDLSLTYEPRRESLRQICERAQARGQRTVILTYDHFFSQYRPGESAPRRLMPDMPAYIERVATIARFAAGYGLGLELGLLSPLEIGPAYCTATGQAGLWMHARKGLRDPQTGAFSVQLWQQQRWVNNKGIIDLEDAGVRVFAFQSTHLPGTPYEAVAPDALREITDVARVARWDGMVTDAGGYRAVRVCVHGEGGTDLGGCDRVLVVQMYRTPEMDYFSAQALPFLTGLVDRYVDAGIRLDGLYSDEMHIQQDWGYFTHHDHGDFALRYASPGLVDTFARTYGEEYRDFARYMIYFVSGQEDASNDLRATTAVSHVSGATPEAIRQTALFRAHYYRLLQNGVVDLFVAARRHLEERLGHLVQTRAHATWAESPTIDYWLHDQENKYAQQYDYTSNFLWSNTVHQAAAACYDYFKWGDYLTGTGNDHAECGWLDRNYVGLALACSTGILNEIPYSYAAHWGMPAEIAQRRADLVNAYGAAGSPSFGTVQEMQHRDVAVLMLYPLDLVALDARFGSWMTQYGYANMISPAKLLELGVVADGRIHLCGRSFTTLVALCEPFPSVDLLDMMQRFATCGGRVIWSGPPPVLTVEGGDARGPWQEIFSCDYSPGQNEGIMAAGMQVTFDGALSGIEPQIILTGLLVDHIYPVVPRQGASVVARVKHHIVGTHRQWTEGGSTTFLGYRPRDDQSRSLGYEARNWFEVLHALDAYPRSAHSAMAEDAGNDNTEYLSRTAGFLACRFPNGAIAVAPHLREVEECWPGGFARDAEQDRSILAALHLPPRTLDLVDVRINGHRVTYHGEGAMVFRVDDRGTLVAFAGSGATQISVDGRQTVFAEGAVTEIAWAPVAPARRVTGGAVVQMLVRGAGRVHIPMTNTPDSLLLVAEGPRPGSRGEVVPFTRTGETLTVAIDPTLSGRWLYAITT